MKRVLVGVDDSDPSRNALRHAFEQFPDAEIHVVHAPEPSNVTFDMDAGTTEAAEERAEATLAEATTIAADYDREVETALRFGNAATELVSYADEHDVEHIVVGSRGRSGLTRVLLGSVAETVVRRANSPVTVVR